MYPDGTHADFFGHNYRISYEKSITSLFVLEDGKPVGIVRLHDCLKAGVA